MSEAEEFVVDTYKKMDAMKAQTAERYEELEGEKPSDEQLRRLCWDVWRLRTFHISAWRRCCGEDGCDASHALYVPSAVVGERPERILAMDARLKEVFGDTVEGDEEHDEEADADDGFDFEPGPDEQIMMVEYSSIIVEYYEFVEQLNPLHLADGDEGMVQNIIQLHRNGFDAVMRLLWEWMGYNLHHPQEDRC